MCCSVLSPEIIMHDDAYIGRRSENNIKCVVHDDLGWKNRTTRYILPRHWLYEWFSQFHRCRTYSVLSRSPSIAITPALSVCLSPLCFNYSINKNNLTSVLWHHWFDSGRTSGLQKLPPHNQQRFPYKNHWLVQPDMWYTWERWASVRIKQFRLVMC